MSNNEIEREIQRKGLTAPRLTPLAIEATIRGEYYWHAGDLTPNVPELATLTLCILVLKNGFTVTGESACASPENFDKELGRRIAREHAVEKIWPLEGYLLKQSLFGQQEALELARAAHALPGGGYGD
jgi:hypothetical protein